MRRKDILYSPRLNELKKNRRRKFFGKVLLWKIIFLGLLAVLVFISRIDRLNIQSVQVFGNTVLETEQILSVVEENISGYFFWLFPRSNFLFWPEGKTKDDLSQTFKRLQNIDFTLDGSGNLSVLVSERQGKYTWCGEEKKEGESLVCYFMDEEGYVFDQAPYFSGDVYFKFFGPIVDSSFTPDLYPKLREFRENLITMGFKPVALYVKKDGDIEIELSSVSEKIPKIFLKSDFEVEQTSETLQSALRTDPLISNMKNKYKSMEYIDLRFGNKVYFKF